MNNNQQNQAMGVLGGLTGFAIVANMADGTSVIAALGSLNSAVNTIKEKVGSGNLPTGATDIIDGLNDLNTSATAHGNAITALQTLVGNGSLPTGFSNIIALLGNGNLPAGATDIIDGLNDLVTALGATNGVVSGHTSAIAALPTVAFKFVKGDTGGSVTAGSSADTLQIVGDGVVVTTYHGGKIKIDSSGLPHVNIKTVAGDNNTSITIGSKDDNLKIYGVNGIGTTADDSDNTLKIDGMALENKIGDLSQLRTTAKTSLVDAINEIFGRL